MRILSQVLILIKRWLPNQWYSMLQTIEIEVATVCIQVILSDQLVLLLLILFTERLESWVIHNYFFLHSLNRVPINHNRFMIWLLRWLITIFIRLVVEFGIIEFDYFFMKESLKFSSLSHLFLMIVRLTLPCVCFGNMASKGGAYIKAFATKTTSKLIISLFFLGNYLFWLHFSIGFKLSTGLSAQN